MRLKSLVIILVTLVSILIVPTPPVQGDYCRKWAVIICGTEDIFGEAFLLKYIFDECYDFDGIYYLPPSYATRAEVHAAFQWLRSRSGSNDLVFIWIGSHGGGFSTFTDGCWIPRNSIEGGRALVTWDDEYGPTQYWFWSKEGREVRETEIFNPNTYRYGLDVNRDGDLNDWVGIDECIWLEADGQRYWDDEFADDVSLIQYRAMVITVVSCFSGGFIDDLSCVARRDLQLDPILTSSNETWPTWRKVVDHTIYDMSWWGENYIHALWPEFERFNEVDTDNNGAISVYEAYYWAWLNDPMRQQRLESPWLDDNGDGRPTFVLEADHPGSDGYFSTQIYLHHEP